VGVVGKHSKLAATSQIFGKDKEKSQPETIGKQAMRRIYLNGYTPPSSDSA